MFLAHAAAVLLALTACGPSVSFVRIAPALAALPTDQDVRVYITHRPETPYQEIGIAEVAGGSLESRVRAVVEVARKNGGNAVILIGSHARTSSSTGAHRAAATVIQPGAANPTVHVDAPVTQVYTYDVDRYVVASVP